jgi:hypothetical protein
MRSVVGEDQLATVRRGDLSIQATTRAMKARMLDEAAHYDQLAADADRAEEDIAGLCSGIESRKSGSQWATGLSALAPTDRQRVDGWKCRIVSYPRNRDKCVTVREPNRPAARATPLAPIGNRANGGSGFTSHHQHEEGWDAQEVTGRGCRHRLDVKRAFAQTYIPVAPPPSAV